MWFWILDQFGSVLEQMEGMASGDSRVFLTARTALASLTSFLVALFLGPRAIRWLQGRFRERIDSASERLNELHAGKQSTPTMGGLFVIGSTLVSILVWGNLSCRYVQLGLFVATAFAALGATDDWIKLSSARNGLNVRQKLAVQVLISTLVGVGLYFEQRSVEQGLQLIWPIGNYAIDLGAWFIPWSVFLMVGSSNAVNLTDGLDGLASGCTVFAGSAFVALTYLSGHAILSDYLAIPHLADAGEVSVVLGALVGAVLGFLWFNCYPAQVFMGDTGSLPIGALLAYAALVTRQEVLLALAGGIFVIETLSVIFQVASFKLFGRRLIACSPLHNHFVFRGDHEIKIVVRFWIGSALLAIVAVASLKIR